MSTPAIKVEGLGKKYLIGHQNGRSGETLRDVLMRKSSSLARRIKDTVVGRSIIAGQSFEQIDALQDVSFSVEEGEVVGIIGRNGAGKSTLLKILSRITKPSSGRVIIAGRIASLLEVGTGFHSELTGRENIFLNGAILGMTRADIRRRFDEIVAFAEVDRFLDTPVKRYSTGMYVRLAFAVAAHLEPDILVVDEVLAVGDAQFQKKCLGKIEEVAHQNGRTVLFVSHQMGMITSLCSRALLLERGQMVFDGNAAEAVARYYTRDDSTPYAVNYTKRDKKVGDKFATLKQAWIEDAGGKKTGEIDIRSSFSVKMQFMLNDEVPAAPMPNFHFYNTQGQCAFICGGQIATDLSAGAYEASCVVPGNLMNNDTYFIDLALTFTLGGNHVSFHERGALSVVIVDPIEETLHSSARNGYSGFVPGVVRPQFEWKLNRLP